MPMGLQILHGADHAAIAEYLVAFDVDSPTFTFGPSFTLKMTSSDDGGICRISGSTVANWRPRSADIP